MHELIGLQEPGTPNDQLLFVLETGAGVGRTNTKLNARQTKYDIQIEQDTKCKMCIQINNAKQKRESSPTTAQIKEGLNSLEHKTIHTKTSKEIKLLPKWRDHYKETTYQKIYPET